GSQERAPPASPSRKVDEIHNTFEMKKLPRAWLGRGLELRISIVETAVRVYEYFFQQSRQELQLGLQATGLLQYLPDVRLGRSGLQYCHDLKEVNVRRLPIACLFRLDCRPVEIEQALEPVARSESPARIALHPSHWCIKNGYQGVSDDRAIEL